MSSPSLGSLLAVPFWVGTLEAPTLQASLAFLFLEYLFAECWFGPTIAALQNAAPPTAQGLTQARGGPPTVSLQLPTVSPTVSLQLPTGPQPRPSRSPTSPGALERWSAGSAGTLGSDPARTLARTLVEARTPSRTLP